MARGRGDGKREEEEEGGSSLPLLPPSVSVSLYLCLTSSYDHAHRAWSAAVHVVSGMYATGAQQYSSIRNCFRLIGYVYGLKQAGGLWLPLPNNPPPRFFTPRTHPPSSLPHNHRPRPPASASLPRTSRGVNLAAQTNHEQLRTNVARSSGYNVHTRATP